MLDEFNCGKVINAYSKEDWRPLLDLIPEIESAFNQREDLPDDPPSGNNNFLLIWKFLQIAGSIPVLIIFDWSNWDEGKKMAANRDFNFDSVDLTTKCKLLSAIIRNNRFCDGALDSAFESGLILKILKSMERQVKGGNKAQI